MKSCMRQYTTQSYQNCLITLACLEYDANL
jgi:hypothetical protein